ncbi:MAG: tRNA (adenosine(37)-N6)-dimethylallyltransferase MiaA [Porphyromonadaceae bacterium]|jgi:tRNA dimethylallyltransferase|nr:tRNA (adenosine(37)-N6)-dimethylallyltransferase MiaA [Porphyromonadaceae bacterium]
MKTLIVILGPTGVGKTNISLRLAEKFGCPIVSSDSRQFYRELKIGTAAPTENELKRVKHYFIGTHSIFDEYSAGQYETDAINLLEELFEKHNVVLLVGGSMMYIDAICKGFDNIPTVDADTRAYWQKVYADKGLEYIQNELKRLDEKYYHEVDLKNWKRVIHALEICSITGKPYSELRTGEIKKRNFNILKIGLNRPRPELYERINLRVDKMVKDGLIDEAERFYPHRQLNTLNTVGYKELYSYWDGDFDLDFAINLIKQDSRRYAKRQLTWFNRDKEINWFHPDNEDQIIQFITNKTNSLSSKSDV